MSKGLSKSRYSMRLKRLENNVMAKKKNELTLKEERSNIRDAIKRALSRDEFAEVLRLERHLEYLEKKIRRKK